MMQLRFFPRKNRHLNVWVFKTQLEYFCALVHTQLTVTVLNCQLSVHQRAAMQQLSAKVFKSSFEYLHIYNPKSGDFRRKK